MLAFTLYTLHFPSPLDLGDELDLAEDALHAEALLELALVDAVLALGVDRPRVRLGLLDGAAGGLDELEDDLGERVDLVVVEDHPPRRLDPLLRLLELHHLHVRRGGRSGLAARMSGRRNPGRAGLAALPHHAAAVASGSTSTAKSSMTPLASSFWLASRAMRSASARSSVSILSSTSLPARTSPTRS